MLSSSNRQSNNLSRCPKKLDQHILTLDHIELMIDAAMSGLGIAFVPERSVSSRLDDGTLLTLLEEWCPSIPGLFLYYPGSRLIPSGLRAFIDVLKIQFPHD
nr:LysR substrate-binding domain-containing protein [uncultured Albidiferax sp.]